MNRKEKVPFNIENAEERLQQGLSLILSALPELLFRWLKKEKQK